VTFSSSPPGAAVVVNGERRGVTPLTVELTFGSYDVEMQLEGHRRFKQTVQVKNAKMSLPATLDKAGRAFVVLPGREGQTLMVDGKVAGKLPLTVDLTEGNHTFSVEGPDGGAFQVTREVKFTDGRAVINL
jgi:hypothetical protein